MTEFEDLQNTVNVNCFGWQQSFNLTNFKFSFNYILFGGFTRKNYNALLALIFICQLSFILPAYFPTLEQI